MAKLTMLKPRLATFDTRIAKPPPKTAAPIYQTPEYERWRAEVIRRAGGRCQDPTCTARHWPGQRLFADHIKELRDGGAPFDVANGMARCGSSHTRKTVAERAKRMRGGG
jgi:hypothetical protein